MANRYALLSTTQLLNCPGPTRAGHGPRVATVRDEHTGNVVATLCRDCGLELEQRREPYTVRIAERSAA